MTLANRVWKPGKRLGFPETGPFQGMAKAWRSSLPAKGRGEGLSSPRAPRHTNFVWPGTATFQSGSFVSQARFSGSGISRSCDASASSHLRALPV